MKNHRRFFISLLVVILLVSSVPVMAAEIVPLTDDEFYSFTYYPECGGIVDISYKISVTSSGRYYISNPTYSYREERVNDVIWIIFVPTECTIINETSTGFTIKLVGACNYFSPMDGSLGYDGTYTYYIQRYHNLA